MMNERTKLHQDIAMREMFSHTLMEENFMAHVRQYPSLFQETLRLVSDRGWADPVRLADRMGFRESETSTWFNKAAAATPEPEVMQEAIKALAQVIQDGVPALQAQLKNLER